MATAWTAQRTARRPFLPASLSGGLGASLHAPPHNHALLAGRDPPGDLIADALLGERRERSETGKLGHCHHPEIANLMPNSTASTITVKLICAMRPDTILHSA